MTRTMAGGLKDIRRGSDGNVTVEIQAIKTESEPQTENQSSTATQTNEEGGADNG